MADAVRDSAVPPNPPRDTKRSLREPVCDQQDFVSLVSGITWTPQVRARGADARGAGRPRL